MSKESHILTKNYINIRKDYFYTVFLPSFEKIKNQKNKITCTYLIANKRIQVNFYSPLIQERMGRALSHNIIDNTSNDDVDLHINVWDSLSARVDIVAPWSKSEYFEQEMNSKKYVDESFLGVYLHGENTINIFDQKNKTAYFWTHDINQLPEWVSAAPLRTILHWFLSNNQTHLIHGAVVGGENKCVLLSAKGGSGKSTTALSCLLSGMDYLADDYVAIHLGSKNTAYSLFNSVKITPDSIKIFPELADKIWNKDSVGGEIDKGKAIIFLSEFFPKQTISQSGLKAIFIPVIKKETRITEATKTQAMLALAPTTLFQLPLASSSKISELREIIMRTPCYFLELGSEIRGVPEIIKNFLKSQNSI